MQIILPPFYIIRILSNFIAVYLSNFNSRDGRVIDYACMQTGTLVCHAGRSLCGIAI